MNEPNFASRPDIFELRDGNFYILPGQDAAAEMFMNAATRAAKRAGSAQRKIDRLAKVNDDRRRRLADARIARSARAVAARTAELIAKRAARAIAALGAYAEVSSALQLPVTLQVAYDDLSHRLTLSVSFLDT